MTNICETLEFEIGENRGHEKLIFVHIFVFLKFPIYSSFLQKIGQVQEEKLIKRGYKLYKKLVKLIQSYLFMKKCTMHRQSHCIQVLRRAISIRGRGTIGGRLARPESSLDFEKQNMVPPIQGSYLVQARAAPVAPLSGSKSPLSSYLPPCLLILGIVRTFNRI